MKLSHLTTSILAAGLLMACTQAESAVESAAEMTKVATSQAVDKAAEVAKDTMAVAKPSAPGVDISAAPSGSYIAEATHAYIAFSYSHQGYSKFKSTDMKQLYTGTGKVTGDLTIKGVTKPITLDVTLNKVGKHFRNGKDMFGISATGNLKRSEHGVDKYAPMGDDVKLMIEVEFQKVD